MKQPSQPQRKRSNRRWPVPTAIAVVAVLVIGCLAYLKLRPEGTTQNLGSGVTVTGENIPDDIAAKPDDSVRVPLKGVTPLAQMLKITAPGGHELKSQLTLRFTLDQKADPKTTIVATSEDGRTWSYLTPKLSADGRTASVATDHLSWWQPLQVAYEWTKEFGHQIADSFTGGFTTEAKHPTCKDENAARTDSYQLSRTSKKGTAEDKKILWWCFGMEQVDGKRQRVLKVVNPHRYPMDMKFHGLTLAKPPAITLELKQLAKLLVGKDHVILFPAEEVTFTVNLDKGKAAGIDTYLSSPTGQALYGLESAISALVNVVVKFGAGKALTKTAKYKVMDDTLHYKECWNAVVNPDLGKMFNECVGAFAAMIGPKAIMLSVVSSVGSLANFFVGSVQGAFADITKASQYAIRIERVKGQDIVFHNMSIFVPENWHVKRVDDDTVGIGVNCTPQTYWDTKCPSFWLLGQSELTNGYQDGTPESHFKSSDPYYPATDIRPCRGGSNLQTPGDPSTLWRDSQPMMLTVGGKLIGQGHTASYHEWRIKCGRLTASGTAPFQHVEENDFTQHTWYLPVSHILVVSDWEVPGLEGILENASWR